MDWGLLDKKAGENRFLREEIVYSSKVRFHSQIVFCGFSGEQFFKRQVLINLHILWAIYGVGLATGRGCRITTGGRAE